MPLHVPPSGLSRREFLVRGSAAVAGLAVLRTSLAAPGAGGDPNRIALLSDTHIPETPDVVAREVNMTANLRKVVAQLVGEKAKPANVLVNGDCAYLKGQAADYANFAESVRPLSEAGYRLHLTMGNHDNRETLYGQLAAQRPADPPVASRHVSILECPHANWFLLDSLTVTNVVTGQIGDEQRRWLAAALDERKDKPAIVIAHHTPQFEPPPEGQKWGGIEDTAALFELLLPRKHVKAFVFGHSHNWAVAKKEDLHLVNLPPVAYVFAAGKPNGWVDAAMRPDGIDLTLHTLDPAHPQSGEKVALAWR